MSRIISGKARLEVESLSLARVIAEAVESVRHAAEAKGIRHRRGDRPPRSGGLRGFHPAAAGVLEPAFQRHQVHPAQRPDRGPATPGHAREKARPR